MANICSKRVLNHVSQLPVSKWYKAYKVETKLCDIAYKNIQEKSKHKDKKDSDKACIIDAACEAGSCLLD